MSENKEERIMSEGIEIGRKLERGYINLLNLAYNVKDHQIESFEGDIARLENYIIRSRAEAKRLYEQVRGTEIVYGIRGDAADKLLVRFDEEHCKLCEQVAYEDNIEFNRKKAREQAS